MPKEAGRFVAELSRNPKKLEQFKRDPDAAMAGSGLSSEDRKILKSGDPTRIRRHLGDDGPPGCMVIGPGGSGGGGSGG